MASTAQKLDLAEVRMTAIGLGWTEAWALSLIGVATFEETLTRTDTAAVDAAATVYVNPAFWAGLRQAERKGVLGHEFLHVLMRHEARRGNRDHGLWNQAADMAINQLLKERGIALPAGVLYPPAGMERSTVEELYDHLAQERQAQEKQEQEKQEEQEQERQEQAASEEQDEAADSEDGEDAGEDSEDAEDAGEGEDAGESEGDDEGDGAAGEGGEGEDGEDAEDASEGGEGDGAGSEGQGAGEGEGEGQGGGEGAGAGEGQAAPAAPPARFGQGCGLEPAPKGKPAMTSAQVRELAAQAVAVECATKGCGAGTGNSALGRLLTPPPARVRWDRILRATLGRATAAAGTASTSYSRRNRRSGEVLIPGGLGRGARIAVAIDSSGSVSDASLTVAIGHVVKMAQLSGAEVFLVVHDDGVTFQGWIKRNTSAEKVRACVIGRGGTSFEGAYRAVGEQRGRRFDALVHLTDGEVWSWPEPPANCRRLVVALVGGKCATYAPKGAQLIEAEV